VFRRRSIGGARCGVLRLRLVNAPRGGRGPGRQALRPGCEELAARAAGGKLQKEARPPRGKTPRPGARRAAARDTGRVAPAGATFEDNAPVGAPPPLGGGGKIQGPGRNRAAGTRCVVRTGCLTL